MGTPFGATRLDRLRRTLSASIDPEAFEKIESAKSFPFQAGQHKQCAAKVIGLRGNELARVAPMEVAEHG